MFYLLIFKFCFLSVDVGTVLSAPPRGDLRGQAWCSLTCDMEMNTAESMVNTMAWM